MTIQPVMLCAGPLMLCIPSPPTQAASRHSCEYLVRLSELQYLGQNGTFMKRQPTALHKSLCIFAFLPSTSILAPLSCTSGDPSWLQGVRFAPAKLQALVELNATLAHAPWLLRKEHIAVCLDLRGCTRRVLSVDVCIATIAIPL